MLPTAVVETHPCTFLHASHGRTPPFGSKPLPALPPKMRPQLWYALLHLGDAHPALSASDQPRRMLLAVSPACRRRAIEMVRRWLAAVDDACAAVGSSGMSGCGANNASPRPANVRWPRHHERTASVVAAVLSVSPGVTGLGFVPAIAYAFVRVWGGDIATSAEATLSLLAAGIESGWLSYAPLAPFRLLGTMDTHLGARRATPHHISIRGVFALLAG